MDQRARRADEVCGLTLTLVQRVRGTRRNVARAACL